MRHGRGVKQAVQDVCGSLMSELQASGVEFLDVRDAVNCRLGAPSLCESKATRLRRALQEMDTFRRLDRAGKVVVWRDEAPDYFAWEERVERQGYDPLNQRVGDRGILHVFVRKESKAPVDDASDAMLGAANEIERILRE